MDDLPGFKLIAQKTMWHDAYGWHQFFLKECPLCGLEQQIGLYEPRTCAGCTGGEEIWAETDDDDCLVIGVGKYNGTWEIRSARGDDGDA